MPKNHTWMRKRKVVSHAFMNDDELSTIASFVYKPIARMAKMDVSLEAWSGNLASQLCSLYKRGLYKRGITHVYVILSRSIKTRMIACELSFSYNSVSPTGGLIPQPPCVASLRMPSIRYRCSARLSRTGMGGLCLFTVTPPLIFRPSREKLNMFRFPRRVERKDRRS